MTTGSATGGLEGRIRVTASALMGIAALAGCSPALDWRESRPAAAGVLMMFPCRPETRERQVSLAGRPVRMQVHSCAAADTTFSLGVVDAGGPGEVTPLLAALQAGAAANVGSGTPAPRSFSAPGATPNPQSGLVHMAGHLPDGRAVILDAAFFVKGMRLYQASVIGEAFPDDASETFFKAIRIAP
ncbi:MAG: hypothetical protein ABI641_00855 [Caldimonas sp.]